MSIFTTENSEPEVIGAKKPNVKDVSGDKDGDSESEKDQAAPNSTQELKGRKGEEEIEITDDQAMATTDPDTRFFILNVLLSFVLTFLEFLQLQNICLRRYF